MSANTLPQNVIHSSRLLFIELCVLFCLCPILLALSLPVWMKVSVALTAVAHVLVASYRMGILRITRPSKSLFVGETRNIWLRVVAFMVVSTVAMALFRPQELFYMVRNTPGLWLVMCVVYCLVSVIPQEFIYRRFFFARYASLVSSTKPFLLINAGVFCLAHVFFHNTLVLALTLVGGLLFAHNYTRHRSLFGVIVEHSAYGLWLFTLGMGSMLAFPGGPESITQ